MHGGSAAVSMWLDRIVQSNVQRGESWVCGVPHCLPYSEAASDSDMIFQRDSTIESAPVGGVRKCALLHDWRLACILSAT